VIIAPLPFWRTAAGVFDAIFFHGSTDPFGVRYATSVSFVFGNGHYPSRPCCSPLTYYCHNSVGLLPLATIFISWGGRGAVMTVHLVNLSAAS
jgi:hypothetical protein